MTHAASWRMFSAVFFFAASLTAVPTPSQATISEYSTRPSFSAAVLRSATDTFDDLNSQFVQTPLTRPMGPYSYSINADVGGQPGMIYGLPSAPVSAPATWLTSDAVSSEVTFGGFAPDINGIGASFFVTTFAGDISSAASLRVTAAYASDSVTELIAGTSDTSFLGFVLDDQLLKLTVAAVQPASGGPYWLTVAGLTVASLSPVPEVPSVALMLIGLFGTLMRQRRRAATTLQPHPRAAAQLDRPNLERQSMWHPTLSQRPTRGATMRVSRSQRSVLPPYTVVLAIILCGVLATSARAVASHPAPAQGINEFDRAQFRAVPGLPEALVASGRTSAAENQALDSASRMFQQAPRADEDFAMHAEPLAQFTRRHPRSAWNASILTNLGLGYYRAGYFGKAITAFRGAWEAGKESSNPAVMAIAERALGELAVMYARVGESAQLAEVLQAADARVIRGPATELIGSARESLWTFREEPGGAYLCGPKALKNLLTALKFDAGAIEDVDRIKSPQGGFSLDDVSAFARAAGLEHRLVLRRPGADVPFPAIVHWKVAHFAAILAERDGKYLVVDPTFGTPEFWVSKAAIDAESTGYFLVPAVVASRAGWESAEPGRVAAVRGKGSTAFNDPNAYTPSDEMLHPDDPSCGMCRVNAMLMLASARLTDTPVGYRPPKGPSAFVRLTYNQREGNFPASFNYFNVGPNWGINFLSFVEDDPNDIFVALKRYEIGGGVVPYPSYGTYGMNPDGIQGWAEPRTGNVIRRVPRDGPVSRYELLRPDGGKYVYDRFDGATSGLRRVFLTRIVDPAGNTMTLSYDKDLRLTSLTDAAGRLTRFGYQQNSRRIATITDPFGRSASLEYNTNGYLSAIVDVIGLRSSFDYGYFGRTSPPSRDVMMSPGGYAVHPPQKDGIPFPSLAGMPGGQSTRGEYLVTSMTTPYGTTKLSFGWNEKENSRFLNITDPLGQTERIEFRHNATGIASTEPDAPSGVFCGGNCYNQYLEFRNTFYWDAHAYRLAKGDYRKAKIYHWRHWYANSNTTSGILESVKQPLQSRVLFEYAGDDQYVRAVSQILDDGTLRATTFQRESSGMPIEIYDARSRRFNFQYDYSSGVPLLASILASNATIARMTYNSQRRPITYTDAAGQVSHATYNAAGQMTSVSDPLGNSTTRRYDALGRLTAIINPLGVAQASFTYDAFDRIATATDSEGYLLAYSYDALNRVMRVTYPDATSTEYAYDKLDLSSVKDRLGRVTRLAYDANRRLTQVTDPLSRVTTYSYHENGHLKSITDPKGNVTSWEIDIQGRPTAKRYADGTKESYAYEAKSGRLASVTDARGYSKTYTYNPDDTLAAISYPASSGTPNVAFGYDAVLPRMVTMRDGIGETRFGYGPLGQPGGFGPIGANKLIKEDGPYGNDTIDYLYDAAGRVVSRTIDNQTETFAYDALGRVVRNVNGVGAFDIRYLGQTRQMVSMASPTVGTTWSYLDNVGDRRLAAIGQIGAGRGFSYTTTAESRIVGMREGVSGSSFTQAWSYNYDDADRLTRASPFSGDRIDYSYDAADNLTSIAGSAVTYNAVNQIQTLGGVPYTYDLAGNVVDDGTRTYSWDAENRLTGIAYKSQPGRTSTFRYDGLGRRLAIVETSTGGSAETRYLWCGGATPCQARSASDSTTRRFYQQGVALAAGPKLYFARDHLGSVRDVLDASTGASISSYDFAPYGKQMAAGLPVDLGFAGMPTHQASGLGLTLFRTYDPLTGRWLSRDPIAEYGGLNLYSYALGSPIINADPLGLKVIVKANNDADWAALQNAITRLKEGDFGKGIWQKLEDSPEYYIIKTTHTFNQHFDPETNEIKINPDYHPELECSGKLFPTPTYIVLAHEIGHALGASDDGLDSLNNVNMYENPVRKEHNFPLRTKY